MNYTDTPRNRLTKCMALIFVFIKEYQKNWKCKVSTNI